MKTITKIFLLSLAISACGKEDSESRCQDDTPCQSSEAEKQSDNTEIAKSEVLSAEIENYFNATMQSLNSSSDNLPENAESRQVLALTDNQGIAESESDKVSNFKSKRNCEDGEEFDAVILIDREFTVDYDHTGWFFDSTIQINHTVNLDRRWHKDDVAINCNVDHFPELPLDNMEGVVMNMDFNIITTAKHTRTHKVTERVREDRVDYSSRGVLLVKWDSVDYGETEIIVNKTITGSRSHKAFIDLADFNARFESQVTISDSAPLKTMLSRDPDSLRLIDGRTINSGVIMIEDLKTERYLELEFDNLHINQDCQPKGGKVTGVLYSNKNKSEILRTFEISVTEQGATISIDDGYNYAMTYTKCF